jgi:hypothetical protein
MLSLRASKNMTAKGVPQKKTHEDSFSELQLAQLNQLDEQER